MKTCLPPFVAEFEISCYLRVSPDFTANPTDYAQRHQVDLNFMAGRKVAPRVATGQSSSKNKQENFYLNQERAVKLEIEFPPDLPHHAFLRTIKINPSLLLYGTPSPPLNSHSVQAAFSWTKDQITRLLATPEESRFIIPGIAGEGDPDRSFWKRIKCEMYWPEIDRRFLHQMDHSLLGAAQGSDSKKIQFTKDSGFSASFKSIHKKKRQKHFLGSTGEHRDLLVSLVYPEGRLAKMKTSNLNGKQLVSFNLPAVASLIRNTMYEFSGFYLPVPDEDSVEGERITDSKVVALLARLTNMPIEKCIQLYASCKKVTERSCDRYEQAIRRAYEKFNPIPFETLCNQMFDRDYATTPTKPCEYPIDPWIADAYGEDANVVFKVVWPKKYGHDA